MSVVIKDIGGFNEIRQRKVMSALLYGTPKAKLALQFETSRGTIIRIEKQMAPILKAESDDILEEEERPVILLYGDSKIKSTSFMIMMFG